MPRVKLEYYFPQPKLTGDLTFRNRKPALISVRLWIRGVVDDSALGSATRGTRSEGVAASCRRFSSSSGSDCCRRWKLCYSAHFHDAEFDAITGCKISTIDIGSPLVRMSYSPTSGHAVIAILEVRTLQTVLYICSAVRIMYLLGQIAPSDPAILIVNKLVFCIHQRRKWNLFPLIPKFI
ncbi:hypothetical protein AKJ16_DCAP18001 [Drosera capensis]